MNNAPVITLTVEHMRREMHMMLSEHALKVDQGIKDAVDAYCTAENIDRVVRQAATEALDRALKEEVRNFFSFGSNGRIAVREAVTERLNEMYPLGERS